MNIRRVLVGSFAISLFLFAAQMVQAESLPTADNVLCVYNSNSQISTDVCNYYLQKRPGAHLLPLDIPESAFYKSNFFTEFPGLVYKEWMTDEDFSNYVSGPIVDYVVSNPDPDITHLAIAKDIPFIIFSDSGASRQSANPLLNDIDGHDFAASFLTGYSLDNIKKMIDKAQASAPSLSSASWMIDLGDWVDSGSSLSSYGGQVGITKFRLKALGVSDGNILVDLSNANPFNFTNEIVGYIGMGTWQQNYQRDTWMISPSARPDLSAIVQGPVANRAIITVYESFFAAFATRELQVTGNSAGGQSKLADAFESTVFGGSNYSRSFSGGVGTVFEPGIQGLVPFSEMFSAYASGRTFAQSFKRSEQIMGIAIGDPIMTLQDGVSIRSVPNVPITAASAGPDQAVTLPATVTLAGTATQNGVPADITYATVTWTKSSGPGTVTFTDSHAVSTTATFSYPGTYTLSLNVSNNNYYSTDQVVVTVTGTADENTTLPTITSFTASPSPVPRGSNVTISWTSKNTSSCIVFAIGLDAEPGQPVSGSLVFGPLTNNSHTFRISCLGTNSEYTVTLLEVPVVEPSTLLPTLTLTAQDSLVDPGHGTRLTWTASNVDTCTGLSGGDDANRIWKTSTFIESSGTIDSGLIATSTTYTIACTGDNGNISRTVTVPVRMVQTVTVSAGSDQNIRLPLTTVTLSGSFTPTLLPSGHIVSWIKKSGPGTVTFSNASSVQSSATFSVIGSYVVSLRILNQGTVVATDDVLVNIQQALVTPDTTAPSVSVVSPTGGSSLDEGQILFQASASDGVEVAGVQFYLAAPERNGSFIKFKSEDTASPYIVVGTLRPGLHKVYAVARDTSNNFATSSQIAFTIMAAPLPPPPPPPPSPPPLTNNNQNTQPLYQNNSGTSYTNSYVPSPAPYASRDQQRALRTISVYTFTRNLNKGDSGEDVRLLQKTLNALGYTVTQQGTGSLGHEGVSFDENTKKALILYQESKLDTGLQPTGTLDNATLFFLNKDIKDLISDEPEAGDDTATSSSRFSIVIRNVINSILVGIGLLVDNIIDEIR